MKPESQNRPGLPLVQRSSPNKLKTTLATMLCCAVTLLWAGCESQQQQRGTDWTADHGRAEKGQTPSRHVRGSQQQQQQRQRPVVTPAPAPAPAVKVTCSDPTWGLVRMTKTMPAEASLGEPFTVEFALTAQACAANVVVRDQLPPNTTYLRSEPAATVDGSRLSWAVGDLEAGDARSVKLWLKADKEGSLVNCASVSADPRVCASIRIVKPAIELSKTQPENVVLCDPIPITLVVKNTGSSKLTGVKVADTLPIGLTSEDKNNLVFDAGTLAPQESKEFKFNAVASRPGKYVNSAEVTSDQGVTAKASAATAVHQAVLAITCKARDEQYLERPFDVCLTVANSGDVAAAGTQVMLPVPTGVTLSSATGGGQMSGNNGVWDLGALIPNSPQQLCATFTSTTGGTYTFNATAKGTCATQVATSCQTRIMGISALLLEKADNPDPIEVGETTTYTVKVTNQGSADDTNIKVVVQFPAEIDPVNASNGGVIDGKKVTFPAYARLAPKQAFEYTITGKGVKVGDARVTFIRTSDGIPAPTSAEESTRVY